MQRIVRLESLLSQVLKMRRTPETDEQTLIYYWKTALIYYWKITRVIETSDRCGTMQDLLTPDQLEMLLILLPKKSQPLEG